MSGMHRDGQAAASAVKKRVTSSRRALYRLVSLPEIVTASVTAQMEHHETRFAAVFQQVDVKMRSEVWLVGEP